MWWFINTVARNNRHWANTLQETFTKHRTGFLFCIFPILKSYNLHFESNKEQNKVSEMQLTRKTVIYRYKYSAILPLLVSSFCVLAVMTFSCLYSSDTFQLALDIEQLTNPNPTVVLALVLSGWYFFLILKIALCIFYNRQEKFKEHKAILILFISSEFFFLQLVGFFPLECRKRKVLQAIFNT